MTFPIPETALAQHTAVLGKTGSGKTSTAKLIIEHVVDEDYRVCILDPIKSDWWGITSSADGRRAGLPFTILGGPRGHVPLHATSGKIIGELVSNGKLPLSILDMANFRPGEHQHFFAEFAETLMRKMRGVVYLVLEEAHFFAPKERAGISGENMAIYWAKMIATAGRTKGIRFIVATQRTQALHNALLGSCDTMIVHRFTAPADQEPVQKWLKGNVKDKALIAKIDDEMSSLPNGTAWLCSGEAKAFELIHFPRIKTFDNTATPDKSGNAFDVKTAPVDQEKLRAIIGDAAKEADDNDPKALKAEVARLAALLAKPQPATAEAPVDETKALRDRESAFAAGIRQGRDEAYPEGWLAGHEIGFGAGARLSREVVTYEVTEAAKKAPTPVYVAPKGPSKVPASSPPMPPAPASIASAPLRTVASAAAAARSTNGSANHLRPAHQKILDALAWWESVGRTECDKTVLAFLADRGPDSSQYQNDLGSLRSNGFIDYPVPGSAGLTDLGRSSANHPPKPLNSHELQNAVAAKLRPAHRKIFSALVEAYPGEMTRDELAQACDRGAASSQFQNDLGRLRTLGIITYPRQGAVAAASLMFLEGR